MQGWYVLCEWADFFFFFGCLCTTFFDVILYSNFLGMFFLLNVFWEWLLTHCHFQALFFGGQDKLPAVLARRTILGIVVDPCAAILVFIVTGLLCTGIKEVISFISSFVPKSFYRRSACFWYIKAYPQSSMVQAIITSINVCAMLFVFVAGNCLSFKTGWTGYALPNRYPSVVIFFLTWEVEYC